MKKIYPILLFLFLLSSSAFASRTGDLFSGDPVKVIQLYPNPATSIVNFEFSENVNRDYTLLIFSFIGKKMSEIIVSGSKVSLPLDNYYRGLYIYQLRDKKGNIVECGKFQVIK
ncbi:MAG: T9SS type A sorting domain-containing protein [Bacteroidota bacterium]|nr:T9SS type A sorting domain-containing protein [Bacteroidota bacterium]